LSTTTILLARDFAVLSNMAGYYGDFAAFASAAISSIAGYSGWRLTLQNSKFLKKLNIVDNYIYLLPKFIYKVNIQIQFAFVLCIVVRMAALFPKHISRVANKRPTGLIAFIRLMCNGLSITCLLHRL